jgi:mannose-6-phosphate isomerase class I
MSSEIYNQPASKNKQNGETIRRSGQNLMPIKLPQVSSGDGAYNIYPVFPLGGHKIFNGYESLAQWIIEQGTVVIDGYAGVNWEVIEEQLNIYLKKQKLNVNWIKTADYLKPEKDIDTLIKPFLGEMESVWGTKCTLELRDFYKMNELTGQTPNEAYPINMVIGTGAALADWNTPVIYIDLPKNELQYRMRAGTVTNLGTTHLDLAYLMYKRFYFVDWVVLNQHKKTILDRITIVADGQWVDDLNWMYCKDLFSGLSKLAQSPIRVRPWFEPGVWGGQWIKQHIPDVNPDEVNYAWSFELIVPENGVVFESDRNLLEVSFDFLMFTQNKQVLGRHADKFGEEFPIRFDFLDTYDGGNLSIQCHPRLKYIQEVFGENITQDETYYILDCQENAKVYLGFQENIDPVVFQETLIHSQQNNVEIKMEDYVQVHQARKHDLFLIPNGTIHSAGAGNLVLEISATPYIFTFKMYDWLRLDLDGNPRPINIDHAFKNLDFNRKGSKVYRELISKPTIIDQGKGWQIVHVPTHPEHFYDVHRIEFDQTITIDTEDSCHVLMLVEGESISVRTADGTEKIFAYAETFVIPAAAKNYQMTCLGNKRAKVIKAFLK